MSSMAVFNLLHYDSDCEMESDYEGSGISDFQEDEMTPMAFQSETPTASGAVSWPSSKDAFVALTADDIGTEQQKFIEKVQELTQVESYVARQLLQQMNWNFDRLAELYYEDEEKLRAKAGIAVSDTAGAGTGIQMQDSGLHVNDAARFECQVCYSTFEGAEEVLANVREYPTCGHAMCTGCWFQHLKTQIVDEGVSVRIPCPGFSMVDAKVVRCNIILGEKFVGQLLKDVETAGEEKDAARTRKRYERLLNDNYVNNNQAIKWCPATDCTSAVRIKDSFDESSFCTDVVCSVGHEWCFMCMDEPHAPANCAQVRDWRKKNAEDAASSSWLIQNTKECPKCKSAINKDGGCNHMHCKQCDYHFCWVCLGHFEHTTYQHTCNKFVSKEDEKSTSTNRASLQRYAHYFERFMNHSKSRELESKLREDTLDKMEKMQDEGNKTWQDVQFMQKATTQLIEARQILQWTYVTGFYQPSWLSQNIFDMNQAELEMSTEKLSNMLESDDIMVWCNEKERVEMINQTNQVRTRVKHIFEALESWKRGHEEENNRESSTGESDCGIAMTIDEPEAAACGKRAASKTAPSAAGGIEGDEGSRNISTPGTQDGKRPATRSTSARYA